MTISIVAAIAGLLFGFDTGVISGALQFMSKTFHLTPSDYGIKEFIVSSVPIGALFGAIFSSPLSHRLGRRNSILSTAVIFIIGTACTAAAPTITFVIIGRLLMGFAVGLSAMTVPMYLAEISPIEIRGAMVFLFQLAITIGLMLAFIMNYLFAATENWRMMFVAGIVLACLLGFGVLFLPRSPRWLLLKNKEADAKTTLRKLRAKENIDHELDEIKEAIQHKSAGFRILFTKPFFMLVVVSFGLFALQQLTGINTVLYYAATVFKKAGFNGDSGAILASVATGATNVIATVIAVWIIDLVGRRKLLFFGFTGMAICLGVLGFAYLDAAGSTDLHIVALIAVLGFIVCFAIGMGGIPYLLMSEIFPLKVRSSGMAVASCANWGFNILVSSTFLSLVHCLSIGTTFLLYAGFCVLGLFFSYFLVPETKDQSLEHIEANLYAGKKIKELGS